MSDELGVCPEIYVNPKLAQNTLMINKNPLGLLTYSVFPTHHDLAGAKL
jgi:hypothetical protein